MLILCKEPTKQCRITTLHLVFLYNIGREYYCTPLLGFYSKTSHHISFIFLVITTSQVSLLTPCVLFSGLLPFQIPYVKFSGENFSNSHDAVGSTPPPPSLTSGDTWYKWYGEIMPDENEVAKVKKTYKNYLKWWFAIHMYKSYGPCEFPPYFHIPRVHIKIAK